MAEKIIDKPEKNYFDKLIKSILAFKLAQRPDLSENQMQEIEQNIKLLFGKQIRELINQPYYCKEKIMTLLGLTSTQYDELLNLEK